ncbi:glycosyltransferase family 2 protein [Aquiflexum sp. TKW24L]|uniref:glycosyltransferase family A protein n=1 Tax=Aquiflexum sp. TKW24L TaxID=2942212 RepID=UPI0020C06496|nr:glycosyltransferase family 2 protein [Aquiflexum sp. TKW24L]MCL6260339.1 glycosyltransferase family 2 protein [Aquiflexum sp. TKW24L]
MDSTPLVTVILTVFNQSPFIKETLESLNNQGYPNLELFVIDNGSKDNSRQVITDWLGKNHPKFPISTVFRNEPMPYCESFNKVFLKSKGKYLIDLSGDDVILPGHIALSVAKLQESIGAACCFSDVQLVMPNGSTKTYYKRDSDGHLKQKIKIGNLYTSIVESNVVSSVSLVFDSEIFTKVGGYDENLSYEDFDIMVRLSRDYQFVFSNHIGIKKRIHSKSFSAGQYRPKKSEMLPSTLKVCQKIKKLNKRPKEDKALIKRILFETKHALLSANFEVARGFISLAKELGAKGAKVSMYNSWAKMKMDVSGLYLLLKKINPL